MKNVMLSLHQALQSYSKRTIHHLSRRKHLVTLAPGGSWHVSWLWEGWDTSTHQPVYYNTANSPTKYFRSCSFSSIQTWKCTYWMVLLNHLLTKYDSWVKEQQCGALRNSILILLCNRIDLFGQLGGSTGQQIEHFALGKQNFVGVAGINRSALMALVWSAIWVQGKHAIFEGKLVSIQMQI